MFVIKAFGSFSHITHSPHCYVLVYVPPLAADHGSAADGIITVRAENLQCEGVLLLGCAVTVLDNDRCNAASAEKRCAAPRIRTKNGLCEQYLIALAYVTGAILAECSDLFDGHCASPELAAVNPSADKGIIDPESEPVNMFFHQITRKLQDQSGQGRYSTKVVIQVLAVKGSCLMAMAKAGESDS